MPTNQPTPFHISDRLALFPASTRIHNDSLFIAGQDLSALADQYGTPLYVYDRATLDAAVKSYIDALSIYYPSPSHITYAGKAFLCKAVAEWTQTHDLFVDCTGEGEIQIAVAGGVPHQNIVVHGVNKSLMDLQSAIQQADTIVVDNLTELKRIQNQFTKSQFPNLWLRLLPGVAVATHHSHTQTGQHDSKFGMTHAEILEAANFCQEHNLPLIWRWSWQKKSGSRENGISVRAVAGGWRIMKTNYRTHPLKVMCAGLQNQSSKAANSGGLIYRICTWSRAEV